MGRGSVWQTRGALLKGAIVAAFGAGILAEVALTGRAWPDIAIG